MHKLQIWTSIEKENYGFLDLPSKGTAKVFSERIGNTRSEHNVEFHIHPNSFIMIYVSCSDNPFRLYTEQDVSDILFYLGRVEDRLRFAISDKRECIVPQIKRWILKCCDINKGIEINGVAQITLPDLQIPLFEKALRGYVKPIGDKVYYRVELSFTPNEPIEEALEKLITEVEIDKIFFHCKSSYSHVMFIV